MRSITSLFIIVLLFAASCKRAQVPTAEVNVAQVKEITLDPNAPVWDPVSLHASKMILQDLVEPRLLEPSTSEVMVKAITNGSEIAFRLEWVDESQSDMPGPKHFIDGCAVQLPARVDRTGACPADGRGRQDGRDLLLAG